MLTSVCIFVSVKLYGRSRKGLDPFVLLGLGHCIERDVHGRHSCFAASHFFPARQLIGWEGRGLRSGKRVRKDVVVHVKVGLKVGL